MTEQETAVTCPLCGNTDLSKWGFICSHKAETWMQKLAQVYMCKQCGTKFAPDHQPVINRYPRWVKNTAIQWHTDNPQTSCAEIAEALQTKFSISVSCHVVYQWLSNYSTHLLGNRVLKSWCTRRKYYGSSGMSENWREKRRIVQRALWNDSAYRHLMSTLHSHPKHKPETIQFCLSLKESGLSLRKIALEANKKFGTKLAHDTIAKWFNEILMKNINRKRSLEAENS